MRQRQSAQNVQASAQNAPVNAQNAVENAEIASSAIQQHARTQRFQLRPQNNFLAALEKSTRPTLVHLCRPCCLN